MSDYEFGVGEYTMRNGWTAWVKYVTPDPAVSSYRLRGYYWSDKHQQYQNTSWTAAGQWSTLRNDGALDLMPPRREWWVTYAGRDEWIEGTDCPERKEVLESEAEELELSVVHFVELRPGEKIISARG